jgi:hypothetical protein
MNIRETIKKIINEDNRMKGNIRQIVRDIITVFKNEEEGEFGLPEYFEDRDEMVYNFVGLPVPLSVELKMVIDESVEDFQMDAEYYRDEHTIILTIIYNPNDKSQITYDLIGELNEVIAHELKHTRQRVTGNYNLDVKEPEKPLEYYSQPHEIDAQYFGFKRLSRLTGKPFEEVVRNWFDTHEDQHGLTDDETEIIIDKVLNHKN